MKDKRQLLSKRFKMFKAGKLWIVAGLSIGFMGGTVVLNSNIAHADTVSSNDCLTVNKNVSDNPDSNQSLKQDKVTQNSSFQSSETSANMPSQGTSPISDDSEIVNDTSDTTKNKMADESLTNAQDTETGTQNNDGNTERGQITDASEPDKLSKTDEPDKNAATDNSETTIVPAPLTPEQKQAVTTISPNKINDYPIQIQDSNGNAYRVFSDIQGYNGMQFNSNPATKHLYVGISKDLKSIVLQQINTKNQLMKTYVINNSETSDQGVALDFAFDNEFRYAINSHGVISFISLPHRIEMTLPKQTEQEVHFSVDTKQKDENGNEIYADLTEPVITPAVTKIDAYHTTNVIDGKPLDFPGYYYVKTIGAETGEVSEQSKAYTESQLNDGFNDFINGKIDTKNIRQDAHGAYAFAVWRVIQNENGDSKSYVANLNQPTTSLDEAVRAFNQGNFYWLKSKDGQNQFDDNGRPFVYQTVGQIYHYTLLVSDPNDPGLISAHKNGGNANFSLSNKFVPSTLVRYVYAPYERPETPGLSSWTIVNTPYNPGNPGTIIDPKIPNDPKQPDGTDKASLEKVITKTIHYVDEQGKQLLADKTYQVTYTRTATYHVNNAGEVSAVEYSDWQTDNDDLGNNGEPSISDYYVKTAEPDAITDNHVQLNAANIETKIVYAQVQIKTAVDVPEAHGWAVDVPEPVYVKTAVDVPEAHGWAVDVPEPVYVKTAVDVPEAHGWAVDVPEPVYVKTAVDVPEAHGWAVDVPEPVYEKTAVDVPEAHGWAVDVPEPVYVKTAVDVPEAHGWAVDVPEPVYEKTAVDVPEAHGWAVDVPEPVYVKTAVDVPEAHGWAVDVPEPIYIKTKVDVPDPAKLTKTETKISNKKIVKNDFERPTLQSPIDQNNFKEQLPQTSATPKKSESSIIAVSITLVCSLLMMFKKLNHKFF
ncbi:MAG: KxYKxGKxW signal peptide domain-containing protein [Leuconostoc pseudomesenteroides]|uniref:mucin-binding protein n=1 Tax=Leuconostoc pseudomesenteroides TaxID=33968 RepID=UPI0039E76172